MTAPPYLSPFVRTRTRLSLTIGLVLAALTAALLPWWQPDSAPVAAGGKTTEAKRVSTGPKDEVAARAEAVRSGKKVLVDTATTATSLTWALPNGQMRSQMHALPQRAKNAAGDWAPIDNKLTRSDKAPRGLGITPVNAALPVRFAGGTKQAARADRSFVRAETPGQSLLAEVEFGGHTIAYTWPGALPEPVLDGPRALYSEVLRGVDLLLVAREEGGFAQVLIVKNEQAAQQEALKSVSYGLRSATATFRHDTRANRVLVLDKAGKEVGSIPTPFAWDSSGRDPELPEGTVSRTATATSGDVLKLSGLTGIEPGAKSAQLPVELAGDKTGDARLALNVAGSGLLAREGVKYPVFVDPTMNSGWQAWTTAYRPYPNSSFYNGTNFSSGTSDARVGYESDTGGLGRSFWRMGFDAKMKGATVTSAAFKVLNNHSWSCTSREFKFYFTGAISSGTTWNAQPSWTTHLQSKSFAHGWSTSCPDDYETFNNSAVVAAAQQAATGGWSNITFGMRATSESDTQTWRKFRATSATFEVDFNTPPNEPTSGTSTPGGACVVGPGAGVTVGKTNIVLKAYASDNDGNLTGLRFKFWKAGAAVPAGTLVTPSGGWASTTIPATSLEDKATYYWAVRAEDGAGAASSYFPPNTAENCALTVDGSAPPPPTVDEDTTPFKRATSDGATWASVKFGGTGNMTITSPGAAKFRWGWEGMSYADVTATNGAYTLTNLTPPHAGPNWMHLFALDALGNVSARTDYATYVPPRDAADGPGDVGGDGIADLLIIDANGNLFSYPGTQGGELYGGLTGSYTMGTDGKPVLAPKTPWWNGTKAALISHYADVYPGDGSTDLFAVDPDGTFYLYPGDGYGTFNVDDRLPIRLPANTPAPSTWVSMKAIGDITGDKLTDVAVKVGTQFWLLSGYTGATFQTATLMEGTAWGPREIVNIADIDLDGAPDLLWRSLDSGTIYIRHGKPGPVAGSVDIESLKLAGNSRQGSDTTYGSNWTTTNISAIVAIPDVNGDRIPDLWVRYADTGNIKVYYPSATNTNAAVKTVLSADWRGIKSFG
ncbi:DNRLRE domain-containing protein [Streptomyces sp. NPDC046385]|uniref:FG-GAP repeat domain-containing protein n=1 Tax=Streptomyces sp. NPDC046385 TaxID=3154918 RepID=UPI0033BFD13A